MAIFLFFQNGGCSPSWISYARVWTIYRERSVVFIIIQNFVGIDAVVSANEGFSIYRVWLENFYPRSQNGYFGGGFDP